MNMRELQVVARGKGSCADGDRSDPHLRHFPLLACVDGVTRTEDGKAAVARVLADYHSCPGRGARARAKELGTTEAHVRQALAYAIVSGMLDI